MSGRLVSDVTVQPVCFSDHHLLTGHLGVWSTPPSRPRSDHHHLLTGHLAVQPIPPVKTRSAIGHSTESDRAAFCHDILRSKLFGSIIKDADEYADLFDVEVKRVLDIHATCTCLQLLTQSTTRFFLIVCRPSCSG